MVESVTSIDSYVQRLYRVASAESRQQLMTKLGYEVVRQVRVGFDTRSDPYGSYWKSRKADQPWPLLEKTGKMRNSFAIQSVSPDHVRVTSNCEYAPYHQYGTSRMPSRKLIPNANRGLGVWAQRLRFLSAQHVVAVLRG